MKGKYLVITFLFILLGFIIYKMMRYESKIRSSQVVKIMVHDDSKPLIKEMLNEQLYDHALKASYSAMAKGDYFKVANTKMENGKRIVSWESLFLKGVNLGVAMPGKYPTEFSLGFNEYLNWFLLIGKMNANVIRIYTILPPEFYEALSYYNLHYSDKKLYLLQGVWIEEPEQSNYFHPKTQREFQKEIIDVLDVIHGNSIIEPRSGHASGTYVSNVADYVIGIILGREWEPKAVSNTNAVNSFNHSTGTFISVNNATPMEVWLAQMMDFSVLYETQTYDAQHPVSFVNWLTLDPMYHTMEFIENKKIREYDNDKESLDLRKFSSSELFAPGIFASYHVYPYYPDFIYLQKNYTETVNRYGQKDNFSGYLQDLKAHHTGIPLVIAEYGLPSSRGNSHYTPDGFNQGGLSEKEQAERSKLLTYDIADTHCAGAVFFEWIDEWFKFNWLVMDFEQPQDRRMFWHNMENPEKNFGVMAVESKTKTLDGKLNDWKISSSEKDHSFVECDADASYFYIAAHLPNFSFKNNKLYIAIDTYDKNKGERKLPFLKNEIENGVEFLLSFDGPSNAKILVDDQYSVYTDIYNAPVPVYGSKKNNNGKFLEQYLLANRSKITLLGDTIPAVVHNRSKLIHGNNSKPEYSNADWFWNDETKNLEIRLTWHLLNVSDPSHRNVLDDQPGTPDIEYTPTPGFNLLCYEVDKNEQVTNEFTYSFTWKTWEQPTYTTRLKPIYYYLQNCFTDISSTPQEPQIPALPDTFTITPYYQNKKAAVSILLSGNASTNYLEPAAFMESYGFKASFGLIGIFDKSATETTTTSFFKNSNSEELLTLLNQGHEIVLQVDSAAATKFSKQFTTSLKLAKTSFKELTGTPFLTIQYPAVTLKPEWLAAASTAGIPFVQPHTGRNTTNASTILMTENSSQSGKKLDSILQKAVGKWTVFNYPHVLEPSEDKPYRNVKKKDEGGLSYELFKRHVRLYRNSNYWIAPIANVQKYVTEKEASSLSVVQHDNLILLTIKNNLDTIYNHPLTVEYRTSLKKIKITNSAADGIYETRNGKIYFNAFPKREVIIEILEK